MQTEILPPYLQYHELTGTEREELLETLKRYVASKPKRPSLMWHYELGCQLRRLQPIRTYRSNWTGVVGERLGLNVSAVSKLVRFTKTIDENEARRWNELGSTFWTLDRALRIRNGARRIALLERLEAEGKPTAERLTALIEEICPEQSSSLQQGKRNSSVGMAVSARRLKRNTKSLSDFLKRTIISAEHESLGSRMQGHSKDQPIPVRLRKNLSEFTGIADELVRELEIIKDEVRRFLS